MKRFLPPILLVAAIVLTAPFMGVIRDVLFDRFEAAAIRYLAILLALIAILAFAYAVARIREHRGWRYLGLVATAGLLWIEVTYMSDSLSGGGIAARVSVVEKIHIVQYGLLALLLYRACKPLGDLAMLALPLLGVTVAGVLDESMQWWISTRTGDIDDVFLNMYSGLCGLVFAVSLDPPQKLRFGVSPASRRQLVGAAILAVTSVGLFYDTAHLGYEHYDPAIGRFLSWHSMEDLRAAAEDREEGWRVDPPTGPSPWRAEDRFLAEAGWYAGHRNERYEAGDAYHAAQANRILEAYYGPFLDLEFYRGSAKQRYPPEMREALEAKAPAYDPAEFKSPVLRHRIKTWPSKPVFYGALAAILLVIWGVPWLLWGRRGES